MNDKQTFKLYEKLYFHEIEMKETINGRLQIPLVIILSFTGAHAYLIRGFSFANIFSWHTLFFIMFIASFLVLIGSIVYFVKVSSGKCYKLLPTASTLEKYKKELIENHSQSDNSEELASRDFSKSLFNYYKENSSANAEANDQRSEWLHLTNILLAITATLLISAFSIYTLAGIKEADKISVSNPVKVEILEKPLQLMPK